MGLLGCCRHVPYFSFRLHTPRLAHRAWHRFLTRRTALEGCTILRREIRTTEPARLSAGIQRMVRVWTGNVAHRRVLK